MSGIAAPVRTRAAGIPCRTLALVFPRLPIERLRATRPHLFVADDTPPIAIAAGTGSKARLVALDVAASRSGLTAGLTLAAARARVPALAVFDDDPVADHHWLERLAARCGRYVESVTLRPPDALTLASADAAVAFGDEHALAADLEARFARAGVAARYAWGGSPAIAEALARYDGAPAPDERGAVRRLPIAALGLDGDTIVSLADAGLRTVGDAMALSRTTLAARFGIDVATAVQALREDARTPPSAAGPAPAVRVERRFGEPVTRIGDAVTVVADLIAEAGARLAVRDEGARRWRLELYRAAGDVVVVTADVDRATTDPAVPLRLLRERVATLTAPSERDQGFDLFRLDVVRAEAIGAGELKLEGGAGEAAAARRHRSLPFPARGGRQAIEQAELRLPDTGTSAADRAIPEPGVPARLIHLFDPPQPIEGMIDGDGDDPPRRFRWRRAVHETARVEGPERHAGAVGRPSGGTAAARDYWRVEDRRGRRLWLFRDTASGADRSGAPRWYVHGLFA